MLVVVSDLHLTDGTSGQSMAAGAFSLFATRIRELAVAASWRIDGGYRPVEQIDLVLLGDTLDLIRSARWLEQPLRPWSDPHSAAFLDVVAQVVAGILDENAEALSALRALATGGLAIPAGLRSGKPTYESSAQVPVRIHYMVGNHDWFLHLPDNGFEPVRQAIASHMGLCTPVDRPFPHDMNENETLLAAMRRHRVTARHGDVFDPFNFEGDRCASSLGDAIVVELVNRFAYEVGRELGTDLPKGAQWGLKEIDNIRPTLMIPVWIEGLLERTCPALAMRKQIKLVWDRLADDFLGLDFVRKHDTLSPVDLVDGLQRTLKFSKRLSFNWAGSIGEWINSIRGSNSDSYVRHAMAEPDFRNRRSRHIVYGHTHAAETIPLDASYADDLVLNQVYFNAGTWRRVHRATELAPSEHEFIPCDVMTYLAFFQGDERNGRPYESWSGTLGQRVVDTAYQRIDQPAAPAARQPAVNLITQPPHFLMQPSRSRAGHFHS